MIFGWPGLAGVCARNGAEADTAAGTPPSNLPRVEPEPNWMGHTGSMLRLGRGSKADAMRLLTRLAVPFRSIQCLGAISRKDSCGMMIGARERNARDLDLSL